MRYSFITCDHANRRLIALFLGWAMDEKPFVNLRRDGFDIVVFYGYGDIDDDSETYRNVISPYDEVSVIAWSFGVSVANRLLTSAEEQCIAVNGTVNPVDNKRGIPKIAYGMTLRCLDRSNLGKFYARTGFTPDRAMPCRDLGDLQAELEKFGSVPEQEVSPRWQTAHIATDDKIIPSVNQEACWRGRCRIVKDQKDHLPDFQSIIDNDIVDKRLIARRFSDNADSYEANALVQRDIAGRLYEMVRHHFDFSGRRIVEVGSGTGFLTRLYASENPAAGSIAIDLADSVTLSEVFRKKGIAYPGTIVCGDAEQVIDRLSSESFDAVVSSSTIQWFSDLKRFFNNVAKVLVSDGIAAFSTFLPGTFAELQSVSGRSLLFPSVEEILGLLPQGLEVVDCHTGSETIGFRNGREVFRHIKQTGVNAVGPAKGYADTRRMLETLDRNPRLTYNIFYIVLRKKR